LLFTTLEPLLQILIRILSISLENDLSIMTSCALHSNVSTIIGYSSSGQILHALVMLSCMELNHLEDEDAYIIIHIILGTACAVASWNKQKNVPRLSIKTRNK